MVLITEDYLIGIQVNGVISATDGGIPEDVLLDPYYYIDEKYIYKIENEDILGTNIFLKNKTNFKINRKDIKNIIYDSKKKWGMAYYPHDGKVYIETMDGKKREFIIL